MDLTGKYQFSLNTSCGTKDITVLARTLYNQRLHITVTSDSGDYDIPRDVTAGEHTFSFSTRLGNEMLELQIEVGNPITVQCGTMQVPGTVSQITPEDDRSEKADYRYRALILYSSITGNTEKIAQSFKDELEHYRFQVDMLKITSKLEISRDFSDYDLVCLGSPIIAGSPTKVVMKKLSLGGGGSQPTGDPPSEKDGPMAGGPPPGMPPMNEPMNGAGTFDNTPLAATYAGGPPPHGIYQPLGLVFTTYGGGFYGSNEALATLETLKLYLEQLDISIEYLRTNQREKCRLYTSLGIMGGMFLVIVMY